MQFVVKAASIAHRFTLVIATPQRRSAGSAIRTDYSGSAVPSGLLNFYLKIIYLTLMQ